jgi:hypothetical protein
MFVVYDGTMDRTDGEKGWDSAALLGLLQIGGLDAAGLYGSIRGYASIFSLKDD